MTFAAYKEYRTYRTDSFAFIFALGFNFFLNKRICFILKKND